jgi:threonine aldolase
MSSIKEMSIKQYINSIDFNSDDWKLSKIKEDMRKFLGEEPGIDVVYKKDVMINELSGEAKEFIGVDRIHIVFTDTDNKIKKIEFIVGNKI